MHKNRMHKGEILFHLAVPAIMLLALAFFGYNMVKLVDAIFVV